MYKNKLKIALVVFLQFVATGPIKQVQATTAQDDQLACQTLKAGLHPLQGLMMEVRSSSGAENYGNLVEKYNKELARWNLFESINNITNNYISFIGFASAGRQYPDNTLYIHPTLSYGGPITAGPNWGLSAMGDFLTMENTIRGLLDGSTLNLEQLHTFPERVCPTFAFASGEAAGTCQDNQKVSPVFLAMKNKCTTTAEGSRHHICQFLLQDPATTSDDDTPTYSNAQTLIEGFESTFRQAYILDNDSTLDDTRRQRIRGDLNTMLARMQDVSTMLVADRPGGETLYGTEALFGQYQGYRQFIEQTDTLSRSYTDCYDSVRTLNDQLGCPNRQAGSCPSTPIFSEDHVRQLRERLTRCQQCWETDSRLCNLTATVEGGSADGGIRAMTNSRIDQFATDIHSQVARSPILRRVILQNKANSMGPSDVDTAMSYFRRTQGLNPDDGVESNLEFLNQFYREDRRDLEQQILGAQAFNQAGANRPTTAMYANSEQGGRQYTNTVYAKLATSRNQKVLWEALREGQNAESYRERLLQPNNQANPEEVYLLLLEDLIDLRADARTSDNHLYTALNCLAPGGTALTKENLRTRRTEANFISTTFQNCISGLAAKFSAGEIDFDAKMTQSRAELERLDGLISQTQRNETYQFFSSTKNAMAALANAACQTESRAATPTRLSCNFQQILPYQLFSEGQHRTGVEFLVDSSGKIISELTGYSSYSTQQRLSLWSTIDNNCKTTSMTAARGQLVAASPNLCQMAASAVAGQSLTPAVARTATPERRTPAERPEPLISDQRRELHRANLDLLRTNHPDMDSRIGNVPSNEPIQGLPDQFGIGIAKAAAGLAPTIASTFMFDTQVNAMVEQAKMAKTFQTILAQPPAYQYQFNNFAGGVVTPAPFAGSPGGAGGYYAAIPVF